MYRIFRHALDSDFLPQPVIHNDFHHPVLWRWWWLYLEFMGLFRPVPQLLLPLGFPLSFFLLSLLIHLFLVILVSAFLPFLGTFSGFPFFMFLCVSGVRSVSVMAMVTMVVVFVVAMMVWGAGSRSVMMFFVLFTIFRTRSISGIRSTSLLSNRSFH